MKRVLSLMVMLLISGALSSCAFGPKHYWTLEEEQREKALTERLNTARPGEREAIQKQLDDLRDDYKYHLELPEATSSPPPQSAPFTDEEKANEADDAIDRQLDEMNSQTNN
jgi:hypothetical protein